MPDPKQIAVVTPAGDVRTIASTDAADAAEQGFELATPEQVKGAKNEAKFDEASALGKAGYVAGAAGAGALRGISAGLSDAALIHGAGLLGKDSATATRDTLNELRDVAPNASLLGEGAGMIGGLALGSGEVGFGGKALTAVSRAGGLAERGAARLLGEGASSLAGRVAQRGIAGAASAATEGALYGAGQTISEAALGDENLTGEKLVAGMGHGALVGGALGAAFGGVSGAFSRGRSKLADVVAEREAVTAARAETPRAAGVADDIFAAKKPPIGAEIPAAAPPAQEAFAGAAAAPSAAADVELLTRGVRTAREKVEGFTGKTISELADKEAVAHTIKTLGATQGQVQKLAKFGDVSAAAKDIYREVEAYTKHDFMRATKQDILDTSKAVLGKTNEIKRGMLSELDGAGVAAPSVREIRNRFEQEVMAPHIARYETRIIDGEAITKPVFMAGKKADFAPALDFLKQMESSDVRTFEDLFRETRNLRQKTKFGAGPTPNEQAHLMDLFNVAENQIESAAETRAPGFVKKWQEIKKLQQSMIFAKEASERGINAAIKNNSIGLRAGFGVAAGIATGSPIGALIAAGLGKAVNEYGDQIAASAFTKLSALTKLRQNVARVDGQVAHGVQKLFGKALPRGAVSDLVDFMSGSDATIKAAEKVAEDAGIKAAAAKASAVEAAATRAPDAVAKAQVAAAARAEAAEAVANVASLRQQAAAAAAVKPRSRIEYGGAIQSAATYAATKKTERENYYTDANDIRMSAARPGALTERIAENLAPYAGSAPKAVAAASATAVRGVTFLASKLPPSGIDPTSLTPQLEKPDRMTSDIAITKWMKYKRAVDNPLSVLADAKSGKLTPEAVEAVKFVYPKIYEQLCDTVVRATVDAKRPLSYQESIRVGILLDRPTDWSMTPKAQKAIQGTYLPPTPAPKSVSSGAQINISEDTMTSTERAAYR